MIVVCVGLVVAMVLAQPSHEGNQTLLKLMTGLLLARFIRWALEPLVAAMTRDDDAAERAAWLSKAPTKRPALSIVIPAYNERQRLPAMLKAVAASLPRDAEVLVVDDGSTDGTADVAAQMGKSLKLPLRVARLSKNRGKGGAVREGAERARGTKFILFADADNATKFSDLTKLEEAASSEGPVIVVGSRAHLEDSDAVATRSKLRNFLMRGFHVVVSVVGGVHGVRDTQCGFKLVSRSALPLLTNLHLERWAFDVELLFLAQRLDVPIKEVPVSWTEIPGSKLNVLSDSLRMARDIACFRLAYACRLWYFPTLAHSSKSPE